MPIIADISEALLMAGLGDTATDKERSITLLCLKLATSAVVRQLKYDPTYAERTEYYPQADPTRTARGEVWEVSDTTAYARAQASAGSDELQVQHLPVRGITSLRIDYDGRFGTRSGSFAAATEKVAGTDYWPRYDVVDSDGLPVCRDGIIRSEGLWPAVAGSVKLVYFGGYKPTELRGQTSGLDGTPILEACLEETVRRVSKAFSRMKQGRAGFSGPLTSENLGDYSYSADGALLSVLVGGTDLLPESQEKLAQFENWGWALFA